MEDTMSRNGKSTKRNLKLNLSPPTRENPFVVAPAGSPNCSSSSSSASPPSSGIMPLDLRLSSSPKVTSMILLGCPSCLLYVMLPESDPRCPSCKSTVLLDFLNKNSNIINGNKASSKS